jgi:hypothetical protein
MADTGKTQTDFSITEKDEEEENYEKCVINDEKQHSDFLEKLKISSAENYRAGFLAGSGGDAEDGQVGWS